MLWGKNVLDIS